MFLTVDVSEVLGSKYPKCKNYYHDTAFEKVRTRDQAQDIVKKKYPLKSKKQKSRRWIESKQDLISQLK